MQSHAKQVGDDAIGQAFAAEVQAQIEQCGLRKVLTARYEAKRHVVQMIWPRSGLRLEFPVSSECVAEIRAVLPVYARSRLSDLLE